MSGRVAPSIVKEGLVLYLDAANTTSYTSGSLIWNDLTGNGNSGSLINGPIFSSDSNGTIVFDGVNDGVNCGKRFDLQIFTCIIWTKPVNGGNFMFSVGSTSPFIPGWGLFYQSSFLQFDHASINIVTAYLEPNLYNGNWYQLGIFRDSSNNAGIIINGKIVVPTVYSNTFTNSDFWIGRKPGSSFFTGSIANVSVYNRGLSSQEILQNYNALKRRFNIT